MGASVMIRYAVRADINRCVELIQESHKAAGFEFKFMPDCARSIFLQHVFDVDKECIVLELDGQIEGLLLCAHGQHPFGAGRVSKETLWYISMAGRGGNAIKMLKQYEKWATEQKCDIIAMASLVSNDVSKLYERLGYKPLEVHFIKAL